MRVVVVGGGVVGLCCAYALGKAGADVTVVELGKVGRATSAGNAGWITPSLSAPIPAPGVMGQALKWMLKSDSPLLVRPRLHPSFLRWSWSFWRSCSPARYGAGLRATLALNARTLELFDELRAAGVEFEMHSTGIVFAALSGDTVEHYSEMFHDLRDAGYDDPVDVLDAGGIHELEPALARSVVGGFHVHGDRCVRPETLVDGLATHLRGSGVELVEQAEVLDLVQASNGGGTWRIVTRTDELRAERVVVAAGVWSRPLLSRLGVRLPLEAAKGYSVTATGRGARPAHPLYLTEAKVGFSPFAQAARLAGTLELTGLDLSLNRGRIDAIVRAASSYLRDWSPADVQLEWAGLRPLAPDGLPFIGAVPGLANLYVAAGHGMLGVTLAPATGAALAPLVLEGRLVPELVPFALHRGL
ncbi:MAG: NAD(P)/FAD-dependent oxidoreductase [Gaiellaceae bacterium]